MSSSDDDEYDIAVVGGGPAGLTTALYGARLGHETVLIDRGGGRAAMMADTHNVIGVTEETSGNEFLATGREQVQSYGGTFERGFVTDVDRTDDDRFRLSTTGAEILPIASCSPPASPTSGRIHRSRGRARGSTTVSTVMRTCSSTSRCT